MSTPLRIRDIEHGIRYSASTDGGCDVSGLETEVLKAALFRSKNARYRAETSRIEAPEGLYTEVHDCCVAELRRRDELSKHYDNGETY